MTAHMLETLVQLGFAGAIAAWLIYWLTTTFKNALDANTKVVLAISLQQAELYRLLIQHDAQIRGVNPTAGADATEAHQTAAIVYRQVLERLDLLEQSIKSALDGMKG